MGRGVLSRRVSVQGGLCSGGLCPGGSVQGNLCPGDLCLGGLGPHGGLCQGDPVG